MGKKASLYLLYNLFIIFTILLLITAIGCNYSSGIDPNNDDRWIFLGMATPVVILANLSVLILWIIKRKWLALIPLAALIVNVGYISSLFQLPGLTKYKPDQYDVKVASYNVHGFRGEMGFRSIVLEVADMLAEEKVDIVCLQEFRDSRTFKLDSMTVAAFATMPNVYHQNGIAIFSRFPIKSSRYIPFMESKTNGAMMVDVDVNGRQIRVFALHLHTTGIASLKNELDASQVDAKSHVLSKMYHAVIENSKLRAMQVNDIRKLIDSSTMPVIVAGDLNDMPSSFTYHRIKGDMKDGFKEIGKWYAGTFRSFKGLPRLDYIFFSKDFSCLRYYCLDVELSDHRPVFAEFTLD